MFIEELGVRSHDLPQFVKLILVLRILLESFQKLKKRVYHLIQPFSFTE
ncbi:MULTISPECIES: hypothetical protein [Fischerella]|nr:MULTISPECIES: hypothetical protein [Fischerella]